MRQGAIQLTGRRGQDNGAIYASVGNLALQSGGERCKAANIRALEAFETAFLPDISGTAKNLMQARERPVDFGVVELIGGPHFTAVDRSSKERYVYLHPSQWKDLEVKAFCELLTVVVEKRFAAKDRDVWFLDLRGRRRIRWASKRLIRRKCRQAAELLVAFQSVDLGRGEE